jgi:hypothetical protein
VVGVVPVCVGLTTPGPARWWPSWSNSQRGRRSMRSPTPSCHIRAQPPPDAALGYRPARGIRKGPKPGELVDAAVGRGQVDGIAYRVLGPARSKSLRPTARPSLTTTFCGLDIQVRHEFGRNLGDRTRGNCSATGTKPAEASCSLVKRRATDSSRASFSTRGSRTAPATSPVPSSRDSALVLRPLDPSQFTLAVPSETRGRTPRTGVHQSLDRALPPLVKSKSAQSRRVYPGESSCHSLCNRIPRRRPLRRHEEALSAKRRGYPPTPRKSPTLRWLP